MFKVGFSSRIITPRHPMWLGGFAARNKPSCGIHDQIYAKAFFISDGKANAVMTSCDTLCLMQEQVEHIREKSLERFGIKNVSVSATHTHSAPETRTCVEIGFDSHTEEWLAFVEDMTVEAIGEAIGSAEPVNLYSAALPAPGVAKNRRAGETTVDDTLMVIRAEDMQGRTKGLIINYACHCTVLDANNYLISADYPGYIYKKLSEKYDDAMVMFFNGACGNINIGYSADASALGEDMGGIRTYENAEKKADILIEKVDEILMSSTALEARLVYRTVPLEFPLKGNLPSEDELRNSIMEYNQKIAECRDEEKKTKLEIEKIYNASLLEEVTGYHTEGKGSIHGESVIIGFGNVLLITVPLELFCEIGISIKELFSDEWHACILGYTNGYYGYLPTKAAHLAGGYECETSVHSIDSEEYLIKVLKAGKAYLHSRISG
jgi:neutral ceramidase